jgi:hypothetical protein
MQSSILRAVIWQDNSSDALFSDKSFIHLSKELDCFTFIKPDGREQIKQLTTFATNFFDIRKKVKMLVDFVNQNTERPFICRQFNEPDEQMIFKTREPIEFVCWKFSEENVEYLENGGIQIYSVNKIVRLTLSSNGQFVYITFPAQLHSIREYTKKKHNNTIVWNGELGYEYAFVSQMFSIRKYPSRWKIPVYFAKYCYAKRYSVPWMKPSVDLVEGEIYKTELPSTKLPFSGQRENPELELSIIAKPALSKLHASLSSLQNCVDMSESKLNIVLEYTPDATYRYIQETGQVELIFHEDDSCVVSSKDSELVFHHYMFRKTPIEQIYTIGKSIPERFYVFESGSIERSYPLKKMLEYAIEFRKQATVLNEKLSRYSKLVQKNMISSVVEDTVEIPNVGRYNNNANVINNPTGSFCTKTKEYEFCFQIEQFLN